MFGIETEKVAAILQAESRSPRHDTRTEARIVALDQRDAVSIGIDDRQVRRVPVTKRQVTRRNLA